MDAPHTESTLQVRGLAFGYDGQSVQHDVSFEVKPRSIFAIMGESGCGKSTLLKTMIGLLRPTAGSVHFGARDYWSLDQAQREAFGRRIGVLFQGGALWSSMTAAQNVALPLQMFTSLSDPSIDALVQLKLSLVGLNAGRASMPADLSGGMRKRVALARAAIAKPALMLYDEPTSGLDPVVSDSINKLMVRLGDELKMTSVIVTHDMVSAREVGDRIAMLYEGRIYCVDQPDVVLTSKDPIVHRFVNGISDASDAIF
jgi:phospholipid/cholesterol/gamma-HCH transport system ATP-binding protein